MAFIVRYVDKEDQERKELVFQIRSSADERMRALLEEGHAEVELDADSERRGISMTLLFAGAAIIALGVIAGIIQGMTADPFHIGVALISAAPGIVAGLLLIGFAEAIHLLDQIHKKVSRFERKR